MERYPHYYVKFSGEKFPTEFLENMKAQFDRREFFAETHTVQKLISRVLPVLEALDALGWKKELITAQIWVHYDYEQHLAGTIELIRSRPMLLVGLTCKVKRRVRYFICEDPLEITKLVTLAGSEEFNLIPENVKTSEQMGITHDVFDLDEIR